MRRVGIWSLWAALAALFVGPLLDLAWYLLTRTPEFTTTAARPSVAFDADDLWTGGGTVL